MNLFWYVLRIRENSKIYRVRGFIIIGSIGLQFSLSVGIGNLNLKGIDIRVDGFYILIYFFKDEWVILEK